MCDAQYDADVTPCDDKSDADVTLCDDKSDAKCDDRDRDRVRDRDRAAVAHTTARARNARLPRHLSFPESWLKPLTPYGQLLTPDDEFYPCDRRDKDT